MSVEMAMNVKAVVEHEYTATTTEEMSLREGEIVSIEYKDEENGWWVGENIQTGEAGIFPGAYVTIFDDADLDLPDYEASLELLADELGKFEGEGSDSGDKVFLNGILAEIRLNTTLALKGGFCTHKGLTDPAVVSFFTAEVLAGIAIRSLTHDGILLINGLMVPGMIKSGVAATVGKFLLEAKTALATIPIDKPEVSELLQSSFARSITTEEITGTIGAEHLSAFKSITAAIVAAQKALVADKEFMKQYKATVAAEKSTKPQTKTELVKSISIRLKDKLSVSAKGLTTKARELASKAKTTAGSKMEQAKPHMQSALSKAYTQSLIATMKMKTFAQTMGKKVDIEKLKALAKKKAPMKTPPPRPPPPTVQK